MKFTLKEKLHYVKLHVEEKRANLQNRKKIWYKCKFHKIFLSLITLHEIILFSFESLRFLSAILDNKTKNNYKGYVIYIKEGLQLLTNKFNF